MHPLIAVKYRDDLLNLIDVEKEKELLSEPFSTTVENSKAGMINKVT